MRDKPQQRTADDALHYEMEVGVIAACWDNQDNALELLQSMEPRDFDHGWAREQFGVLREAWMQHHNVSHATLLAISRRLGAAESYDSIRRMFMDGTFAGHTPNTLRPILAEIRREGSRRRLLWALQSMQRRAETCQLEELDKLRDRLVPDIEDALAGHREADLVSEKQHWLDLADWLRDRDAGIVGEKVFTGIESLDRVLGGLDAGQMAVLAARPRMGKTAKGLQIARYVAETQGEVLFLSLELARDVMRNRIACQQLQMPIDKMTEADARRAADECERKLHVYYGQMNPEGLQRFLDIKRLKIPQLKLVVVDHLGILAGRGADYKMMSAASNAVRDAAKSTGLPILALAQLGRKKEGSDSKRPDLGDLYGSGTIEQDARKIVFLHRQYVYDRKGDPFAALAIVAKNGEGSEGDVKLHYNGPVFTFSDAPAASNQADEPRFPTHNAPEFEETDCDVDDLF